MRLKIALLCVLLLPLCHHFAQAQEPAFTAVDLGNFGWYNLEVTSINNAGQITAMGFAPQTPGCDAAVIKTYSGNVATITNLSHSGGLSFACSINDSGQIAGYYSVYSNNF